MSRTLSILTVSLSLLGCGAGIRSAEPPTSTAPPQTTTVDSTPPAETTPVDSSPPAETAPVDSNPPADTSSGTDTSTAAAALADCLVGTWDADAINRVDDSESGADLTGVSITFDGSAWTVTAVEAAVDALSEGDIIIDGPVNGAAEGAYTVEGSTLALEPTAADTSPATVGDTAFADVLAAVLPAAADVSCDGATATLIAGPSVVVLVRPQPTADTSAPDSGPDSKPRSSVAGLIELDLSAVGSGEVEIDADGTVQIDTYNAEIVLDCQGRDVAIGGLFNTIVLTGQCSELEISGIRNGVTIEAVDTIVLYGSFNTVTWQQSTVTGETPAIEDNGVDNVVQQG